jgi:hypothetical protein
MTRRNLLTGVAMSALSEMGSAAAEQPQTNVFLELKKYQLHTSPEDQAKRLADFLRDSHAPALTRAGAKLIGAFTNYIGPEGPFLLTVTQYDSLANMESTLTKLAADAEYKAVPTNGESSFGYPYQREESILLKTFNGMPRPLLSDPSDQHPLRFLEMRRYESPTEITLARKVRMFNEGEIGVFQRLGMRPVFFGETIIGEKMPNLVYMLSFDSLADREEAIRNGRKSARLLRCMTPRSYLTSPIRFCAH